MRLIFEAYGQDQIDRELLRFADRAEAPTQAWDDIVEEIRDQLRRRWRSRGNGSWPPLAASTAAAKGHDQILYDTGALFESWTSPSGKYLLFKSPTEMEFRSTVDYGRYHQDGTSRMPQRRIIDFSDFDKESIMKILQRQLLGRGSAL